MLKTKPLWRTGLIYASLGAFISMAFDCFIWREPQTPDHYLLYGFMFGTLMTVTTHQLERRKNKASHKTSES